MNEQVQERPLAEGIKLLEGAREAIMQAMSVPKKTCISTQVILAENQSVDPHYGRAKDQVGLCVPSISHGMWKDHYALRFRSVRRRPLFHAAVQQPPIRLAGPIYTTSSC